MHATLDGSAFLCILAEIAESDWLVLKTGMKVGSGEHEEPLGGMQGEDKRWV